MNCGDSGHYDDDHHSDPKIDSFFYEVDLSHRVMAT